MYSATSTFCLSLSPFADCSFVAFLDNVQITKSNLRMAKTDLDKLYGFLVQTYKELIVSKYQVIFKYS